MSIAQLIGDALLCLEREHPAAHAEMSRALGDRAIDLEVSRETLQIALAGSTTSTIEVATDIDTLCAVLYGEIDAVDAILDERLRVIGAPDDLIAAADATTYFITGALRCASMHELADRLNAMRRETV